MGSIPAAGSMIPKDAVLWTPERTIAEIVALRPQGWTFAVGQRGGGHHVLFRNEAQEVVWEFESPASNLALFEAYAYLVTRSPSEVSPNWGVRPMSRLSPVRTGPSPAVPQDLDPEEVLAVYEAAQAGRARTR